MNKVILFAVIGAVGGTMIGAVGSGVRSRNQATPAVDSTKTVAPISSPASPQSMPDTAAVAVPDSVAPVVTDSARRAPTVLDTAQTPMVRATIDTKAVDTLAQRAGRLAKLFTAMPARDAAKVLAQLDDVDVQRIIAHIPDRQAAAILSNFPADRAAAVTRLTLARAIP
jgi:hypothetical protein